ncbi:MAG: alpha/beta fold hydrolase [Parvibaculaceae bacterium]|nr:alpha/beta fold hydrolase [Parvibaculaceae bacterium]
MTYVKAVGVLLVAIALIMLMSYWAAGRARAALDADAREKLLADGIAYSFIDLPDGTVHYRLEGPENGQLVVLVHGFATPSVIWADYVKPLTDAGYRVLAFDNYGRGLSDRPATIYDADLFDRQLTGLLDAVGANRRVDIVGYSMGGAIVAVFAARHPERIRSVTLIAPAGLGKLSNARTDMLMRPVIGDWIIRLFGTKMFYAAAAEEAKHIPNPGPLLAAVNRQLQYRGYGDALLSTMRHYPLETADTYYSAVGASSLPVLAIWGEADEVVPYAHAERLMELVPQAQLRSYPGMGHTIGVVDPKLVGGLILRFLGEQEARLTSPGAAGKPRGPLARMESRRCKSCGADPAETN